MIAKAPKKEKAKKKKMQELTAMRLMIKYPIAYKQMFDHRRDNNSKYTECTPMWKGFVNDKMFLGFITELLANEARGEIFTMQISRVFTKPDAMPRELFDIIDVEGDTVICQDINLMKVKEKDLRSYLMVLDHILKKFARARKLTTACIHVGLDQGSVYEKLNKLGYKPAGVEGKMKLVKKSIRPVKNNTEN